MKKIFLFAGVFVVSFVVFVMLLILFPPGSTTCDSKFIHYKDAINSITDEKLFFEMSKKAGYAADYSNLSPIQVDSIIKFPPGIFPDSNLTLNITFDVGKNYTYSVWNGRGRTEFVRNYQTNGEVNVYFIYFPLNYTLSFFVKEAINPNASEEKWRVIAGKRNLENILLKNSEIEINKNGYVIEREGSIYDLEEIFYVPWVAILKENISWKTMFNEQHSQNDKDLPLPCLLPDCNFSDITVYNTTSIEEFNGRKVFKVEKIQRTYHDCGWGSTGGFFPLLHITIERETNLIKSFFWIDVNERIVVKRETYDNGTLIYRAELQN